MLITGRDDTVSTEVPLKVRLAGAAAAGEVSPPAFERDGRKRVLCECECKVTATVQH